MRIYDINFAHTRYGENWSSERVAVRGYAEEAIAKVLRRPNVRKWNGRLRVESVQLVASTQSR